MESTASRMDPEDALAPKPMTLTEIVKAINATKDIESILCIREFLFAGAHDLYGLADLCDNELRLQAVNGSLMTADRIVTIGPKYTAVKKDHVTVRARKA